MKNHNLNYSMKLDNISYKIDDKVILNNLSSSFSCIVNYYLSLFHFALIIFIVINLYLDRNCYFLMSNQVKMKFNFN